MNAKDHEQSFNNLMAVKRKPLRLSSDTLIKTDHFQSTQSLPLVITPNVGDLNLITWAAGNREFVNNQLLKFGALLFRDFDVSSLSKFEQFAKTFSPELLEYGERSSPRSQLGGGVYTSTDHPADQTILLHNEQSYTFKWPMKIWFCCLQRAPEGGNTPIADSRKIFQRIDPEIRRRFAEKQVMYVRNYGDGLGLPWQQVFQTTYKAQVEKHCRAESINCEWRSENRLRTWQMRPAIRRHPQTAEFVWFNHAVFFHLSSLEKEARESILSVLDESEVPFNTFYGDGTRIEDSVLEEIRTAYAQEMVSFNWQEGDVLMLDNMLSSHGREAYKGARRIVVAMAEPYESQGTELEQ